MILPVRRRHMCVRAGTLEMPDDTHIMDSPGVVCRTLKYNPSANSMPFLPL